MYERHRFYSDEDDPRPVIFPPPGPYWISGYAGECAIIIVFLPEGTDLHQYWPEAAGIETELVEGITYTSRFPKPEWYTEGR